MGAATNVLLRVAGCIGFVWGLCDEELDAQTQKTTPCDKFP
jgi:hypothetical protein